MRPDVNEGATPEGASTRARADHPTPTRRGGHRAFRAILIGAIMALVAGMSGIPPTSAFGAVSEIDDLDAGDGSTATTSSTTSTSFPGVGDTGTPLDETLDDATGAANDLLDTVDPDGELRGLLEEEEPEPEEPEPEEPDEREEPEEKNEPSEPDDDTDQGTDDEDDEEDEEEESEVPQRTANTLAHLRTFDISNAAPIVNVGPTAVWDYPKIDYVDVPLGPRSTKEIIEVLESEGVATPGNVAAVLAPFPVAGEARYSNDWGAPRHNPYYHPHEGTDIFASRGTPVISSFDGVVTNIGDNTAIGGNSVRVTGADGTYAYYAHLDEFAPGISVGVSVRVGQVVGTVGSSGNARGGLPHLHYEIHPDGGEASPPLPYLDGWLADARARVEQLVNGSGGGAGPVAAAALPPRVQPPSVNPFENASSRRDSPAATLALLAVLGGAILAIRQRRRFGDLLAFVTDGVSPVAERFGFGALTKSPKRSTSERSDEGPVRDVLAPLLRADEPSEEEDAT